MVLTYSALAKRICEFLHRHNPILFAGAGVGCRIGLPTWDGYVHKLAEACENGGDTTAAVLMRERLARRSHLAALSVFKTCDTIPLGERYRALAAPFTAAIQDEDLDKIAPLVGLGFDAVVTTNYDPSLLHAASRVRGRWVPPLQLGGLAGQSLNRDFFVARIHGAAEQPEGMIVDQNDYARLADADDYLDFVLDILRMKSCLFVGFSFVDPAIERVLSIYQAKSGPTFQRLHTAVIPEGQDDLRNRLNLLNIEVLEYPPSDDHADLWRAIRTAFDECGTGRRNTLPPPIDEQSSLHRFIAFAHAQVRSRAGAVPLLEIVQDGMVSSFLAERSSATVKVGDIAESVREALSVPLEMAKSVVDESLDRLEGRDQVLVEGGNAIWCGDDELQLARHLARLGQLLAARMQVREGIATTDSILAVATSALERIFLARAWDMAAHYSGAGISVTGDLNAIISQVLSEGESSGIGPLTLAALGRSISALLTAPDTEEAEMIVSISRAAFGVQLLLSSPRQSLHHKYSLPQKIYLDSNVVMPAITAGHPLRPVYADVLTRLVETSQKAGVDMQIVVGAQFLNEIVSHRRIALQIVGEVNLEDPKRLEQHIQFHGAVNTNVFVGAYASFVGRSKKQIGFGEFLAQVAPYRSEDELQDYLEQRGMRIQAMNYGDKHNADFVQVFNPLVEAYEESREKDLRARDKVLVRHEAQQLTALKLDLRAGVRSVFVTAHGRLRRVLLASSALRPFESLTLSHLGIVAVADVLVGLETDARSFARLVWAMPVTDEQHVLFNFFVDRGLKDYAEGLGTELHQLAEKTAQSARDEAKREGVHFFTSDPDEIAKSAAFLDRLEDRFYENWRAVTEKRRKGDK